MESGTVTLGINRERSFTIDLIKLLASIMIVILHAVRVGGGIREYIYLIGSYGIPLFFVVNGFLMSNKTFDSSLVRRYATRYLRFSILWSLIISIPLFVLTKRVQILQIFSGAVIGRGYLFHLWFLTALVIIYVLLTITSWIVGEQNFRSIISHRYYVVGVVIAMTLSFLGNMVLKAKVGVEIRDVVPAPFRIITNGGYYMLGLHFGLRNGDWRKNQVPVSVLLLLLPFTLILWIIAMKFGIIWASSFYPLIVVVAGAILIFYTLGKEQPNYRVTNWMRMAVQTSSGIWILHPFVLLIIRKGLSLLSVNETLMVSLVILIISILVSCALSILFSSISWANRMIKP